MRADCHPEREHEGRGLCHTCYFRERNRGRLDEYPRRLRTRDEFLADYVVLRGQGLTVLHIAERLGVTRDAVYVAVKRARRAGDPRVEAL